MKTVGNPLLRTPMVFKWETWLASFHREKKAETLSDVDDSNLNSASAITTEVLMKIFQSGWKIPATRRSRKVSGINYFLNVLIPRNSVESNLLVRTGSWRRRGFSIQTPGRHLGLDCSFILKQSQSLIRVVDKQMERVSIQIWFPPFSKRQWANTPFDLLLNTPAAINKWMLTTS